MCLLKLQVLKYENSMQLVTRDTNYKVIIWDLLNNAIIMELKILDM